MAARVAFRGRTTCSCMAEWLPWYEKWLIKKGVIKRSVDIYQLIGNAAASAGYHRSGASADLAQSSTKALFGSRNGGAAGFGRSRTDGMTPHQHLVLKGCPHLTAGAKAQIPELERGGDGLVGTRRDRGPRDGIQWPLRTWQQGIEWFKTELGEDQSQEDDMPTPEEFWKADLVPAPQGSEDTWQVASVLHLLARESLKQTALLEQLIAAQGTKSTSPKG